MADTTFLENTASSDPMMLQQVRQSCEKLIELRTQMLIAEERFEQAKKAYDQYACVDLPQMFKNNGLDMLSMQDGTQLRVVTKTKASILKGKDDGASSLKNITAWLREHNNEQLINSECIVPVSQLEKLKAAGVIYEEKTAVNTNSLKALIIDMLGQTGSPAIITKDDLPSGLSFYQWDEMEVKVK